MRDRSNDPSRFTQAPERMMANTPKLTAVQRRFLDSLIEDSENPSNWCEVLPNEVSTARALQVKGLIEIYEIRNEHGLHLDARLAPGVQWPPVPGKPVIADFVPDMAFAVKVGAAAISMLSMDQMAQVLRAVLEREPEFEEIMQASRYNQLATAAAEKIKGLTAN